MSKKVNSTDCTGLVFTIYSQELNCLFPNYLIPHTAYSSAERIQHTPNWVGPEELTHGRALAGAGARRCHWRRLSAAGCLPGAAGYKVKKWATATAQLLQWPSAMLLCNRNAPPGHARVSTHFLAICNTTYTRMTLSSHTQPVRTAHEPVSSPLALLLLHTQAAQQPDVLTKACCTAATTRHAEVKLQVTWI